MIEKNEGDKAYTNIVQQFLTQALSGVSKSL